MPRRETPGHRGLSSGENDRELNGEEWGSKRGEVSRPGGTCRRVGGSGRQIHEGRWTGMRTRPRHKNVHPREIALPRVGTVIIFS